MRKQVLLVACLLVCGLTAMCQTAPKSSNIYEYASLRVVDDEDQYIVEYSNAKGKVSLWDTLQIDRQKESATAAKFRCFHYLNEKSYELVTSSSHIIRIGGHQEEVEYEYVFRRRASIY